MSNQIVEQFITEIAKNEKLKTKVEQAFEEENSDISNILIKLAFEQGYNITPNELYDFVSQEDEELSLEELEVVVGGTKQPIRETKEFWKDEIYGKICK